MYIKKYKTRSTARLASSPTGTREYYSYIISCAAVRQGDDSTCLGTYKTNFPAIEHACVHLAGAASLADSADFESKGCVRSILDV